MYERALLALTRNDQKTKTKIVMAHSELTSSDMLGTIVASNVYLYGQPVIW